VGRDAGSPAEYRILDTPDGVSELAGFERTRTQPWGSEAARRSRLRLIAAAAERTVTVGGSVLVR
jgi:hypothetical protein